jgi:hypothetical protein
MIEKTIKITFHKKIDFYFEKSDENKDMSDLVKTNVTNDGAKAPSTTSFLGVVIDTENGSSNPKINKALNKSFSLLDIMKFIEVTKFKLNMTMFDYFWQVVVGNQCSLITTLVLEWFLSEPNMVILNVESRLKDFSSPTSDSSRF